MATIWLLAIVVACMSQALALPTDTQFQPVRKLTNTIFGDEKLEGAIFEGIDDNVFSKDTFVATRDDDSPYRLPKTTKPIRYTILWAFEFETFTVNSTVTVQLAATQEGVNQIVMQSNDLNINSVTLTKNGVAVPIIYAIDTTYQTFTITLITGTLEYNGVTDVIYELDVAFDFSMRDDMYGIYRSWYKTGNETKWMATTQFQATAARQAFPCYDEPSFKAYFDITLRRPTAYRSWSNMRIAETTTSPLTGYQDDRYYTTPMMSTYLIAIIVSEYESLDAFDSNGLLTYDVIARPDAVQSGQADYSFDVGQFLLAEMSNHTALDFYSVSQNIKMTQASIPDFGAGAMENWGLLTYREAYLMYAEGQTNSNYKQIIAYILSHEIAHMWFGNLVTCDWWDVLWLNEGFARYYQYFLTHWVEGYMDFETRFITEQIHTSLLSDGANNPQPLTNPGVFTNQQVSSMFSTISYNKGAAVIRMTEHLLGFDVHREGLRNYLSQYAFRATLPIDLFQSLQTVAEQTGAIAEYGPDFNVIDYYTSFTEQPGHPILNVQVNHETGDMIIQQRRFNINTGYSNIETNWIIPISFATASNPNFSNTKPSHIIRDSVSIINRGSVGDEWVIFNIQQTGYYRINYDDYTWDLIALALRNNREAIHEYNRAQIVNDVFQYARVGLMTYTRAFSILSFLENETAYAPWVAAITGFSWVRNRLVGTTELDQLNNMISSWATTVMNDLTYYTSDNDDFMRLYLRVQLAPTMCAIGVTACRTAATAQFQALRNNGVEVHPDNRMYVYCNALRDGTEDDFNFLWTRFQNHGVETEKMVILASIGCTPYQNSLNNYMDSICQDNQLVRPQDYTTALNSAVSGNEVNTQIVFQYMQENLETVISAFGSATTPLSYVSSRLRTEDEINAFQAWATSAQAVLGTSYDTVYNGAESARESIRWASQVQPDFNNFFVNGGDNIVTSTAAPEVTSPPSTESPPVLSEPETPDIPDSASTAVISAFVVLLAAVTNMIFH